MALASSFARTF